MPASATRPRGAVLDIDGVLTVSWRALPGAVDALTRLRAAGVPVILATNTSSRTRAGIAASLAREGFPVTPGDVLTAPAATAAYLATHLRDGARCVVLNEGDIGADLPGVTPVPWDTPQTPDAVVLGGAGPTFGYEVLNAAFRHVSDGARLVAMQRGLFWRTDAGLQLDTGAFLAGLEQATGVEAVVVGKPAPAFFQAALARLGVRAQDVLMVGDDVATDVLAGQGAGMTGVLVRTGKFQQRTLDRAPGRPDHVVGSIADVPALFGL